MGDIERVCDKAMELDHGGVKSFGSTMKVIGKYMTGNDKRIEKAEQKEQQKEGTFENSSLRVLKVATFDAEHVEKQSFNRGDSLTLQVEFKIFKDEPRIDLIFTVKDVLGTVLFGDRKSTRLNSSHYS